MPFPFEVDFSEVQENIDIYIDELFSCLESEFLIMPKGPGFVEYPMFEKGYEALKRATGNFQDLSYDEVSNIVFQLPISLIVLRAMLGFTPPEWAYITTQRTKIKVAQGAARSLDRKIRFDPEAPIRQNDSITEKRIRALVKVACELLSEGAPKVPPYRLHRLDKADTASGLARLRSLSDLGVPYPVLLYERFLGRPFAGHRDSVSELIGNVLENAIEDVLHDAGISYRKTKRAERLPGFDQAPDFIIPNEFNPQVAIEAKLTEDDGTARDKVTRIQHLGAISMEGQSEGEPKFEVVACIAGRGFGVRKEDMKKMILATRGKVFTLQNLNQLVENTRLKEFKSI